MKLKFETILAIVAANAAAIVNAAPTDPKAAPLDKKSPHDMKAPGVSAAPGISPRAGPLADSNVPWINDRNFIGRIMDAHWYWRRIHCAQDLEWDEALALEAKKSVDACTNMPQHDRGGSNLSSVNYAPPTYEAWLEFARTVVHGWHEEELKYPYDNPHYEDAWGHFSQLVWRDTKRIGCAMAHCPDDAPWPGRVYCFYENAGNNVVQGAFEQNVWGMKCADPTTGRVPGTSG